MIQATRLSLAVAGMCALLLAGCASSPNTSDEEEERAGFYEAAPDLGEALKKSAGVIKSGAGALKEGASNVGEDLGTAFTGVRHGFEEPRGDEDYGPYPKHYVELVKKHFLRAMRYPDNSTFKFGEPQKAYMNKGLFLGGGIEWQGFVVDVEIETEQAITGHRSSRVYVVRIRDHDVIDVHKSKNSAVLHRL